MGESTLGRAHAVRVYSLLLVAVIVASMLPAAAANLIVTIAGGGIGDTGAARAARLNEPRGIAAGSVTAECDPSHGGTELCPVLYIADTGHHRIRQVNVAGFITTLAGTGIAGFSDGDGYAVNSRFSAPRGVAADPLGNVYVADTDNNRVRKIDSSGQISTVAGTGVATGSIDGPGGNSADDLGDGPLSGATLFKPWNVAPQGGTSLLVVDSGNDRIRRIEFGASPTITTTAGGGSLPAGFYSRCSVGDGLPANFARLDAPEGLAAGPTGILYLADSGNGRVRQIQPGTGVILTSAGVCDDRLNLYPEDGAPVWSGNLFALQTPSGVAGDGFGRVYLADRATNALYEVSAAGTISTLAPPGQCGFSGDNGPVTQAKFCEPSGLAVWGDATTGRLHLYVADTGNDRIRKIDLGSANRTVTTVAGGGVGDANAATNAWLGTPASVAYDGDGNMYIADSVGNRVRMVSTSGNITTLAGTGEAGFLGENILAENALLNGPAGVATDSSGNVYIADTANHVVRKVRSNGTIVTVAGVPGQPGSTGDDGAATSAKLNQPVSVAVDTAGNIYIGDSGNNRIRWVGGGIIKTVAGTGVGGFNGDGAATTSHLNKPAGVALDATGNLYVADALNKRVRKITAGSDGVINRGAGENLVTVAGNSDSSGCGPSALTGCLPKPWNVVPDSSNGFFITDVVRDQVLYVDPNGDISVAAGSGVATGSIDGEGGDPADELGDGLDAGVATLSAPEGIALNGFGNLIIADTGNGRVREVG